MLKYLLKKFFFKREKIFFIVQILIILMKKNIKLNFYQSIIFLFLGFIII
jgi:hypothetical protein